MTVASAYSRGGSYMPYAPDITIRHAAPSDTTWPPGEHAPRSPAAVRRRPGCRLPGPRRHRRLQRKIGVQHRPGGRGQVQRTIADQADHRQRGQPFGPAGDREPGFEGVRDLVCTVSQPVCLGELDLTIAVHRHHAGESALLSKRVDLLRPGQHPRRIQPRTSPASPQNAAKRTPPSPVSGLMAARGHGAEGRLAGGDERHCAEVPQAVRWLVGGTSRRVSGVA